MYITECPKCKSKINDNSNYCQVCGTKLTRETQESNMKYSFNQPRYIKASIGLRLVAYFLDVLVVFLLSIPSVILIIAGIIDIINTNSNWMYEHEEFDINNIESFILGLILLLIPFVYEFIKDGLWKGQSIGKKAMGLMVLNINDNTPCSIGSSILRKFVWIIINFFPIVGFLVEPIMILANEDGRRLGDLAAGTMVIERRDYKEEEYK